MERRIALKNMGLALGFTVATPTVISLLQSCQQEKTASWVPSFFTEDQGRLLKIMVDIILPKTDTPSASEVNVHVFIDSYGDKVLETEKQPFMKMLMDKFTQQALASSGKENAKDLNEADLEAALRASLKLSVEQKENNEEPMDAFMEALAKGEQAELDAEVASATFAFMLREITIWSYKNTEMIGENVLAYQSIPGEYIPCGDLEELTGGRDYSLKF